MRLALESEKPGLTHICLTCARGTPRTAFRTIEAEGRNMHELLRAIVAYAGVQQITEKAPQHHLKSQTTTYNTVASLTAPGGLLTSMSLLVVVMAVAIWLCFHYHVTG